MIFIQFTVNGQLIQSTILQHMGFHVTTDNPKVMMKENHTTQSFQYIIICQDGLYIVSTTPEEILHMLKDKYKSNI